MRLRTSDVGRLAGVALLAVALFAWKGWKKEAAELSPDSEGAGGWTSAGDPVPVAARRSPANERSERRRESSTASTGRRPGIYERYAKRESRPQVTAAGVNAPAPGHESHWLGQHRISDALREATSHGDAADRLFRLLPSADGLGQASIVTHLSHLSGDAESYQRLGELLVAAEVGPEALDILFTDLVSRDDEIKRPLLTAIAERKDHPFQADAIGALMFSSPPEATP